MAIKTTIGQLLVNAVLPEDLRDYDRVLDKKGVEKLTYDIAERYPQRYREIVQDLSTVGRDAAYTSGGTSFGLNAIKPAVASRVVRYKLQKELDRILAANMPESQRNDAIVAALGRYQAKLADDVLQESKEENNPLASQLAGAGRGNPFSLNSLRGADLMYVDHRGTPIPIPVMHNYGEGLDPDEYFAGAFGARKGIIDLKCLDGDTLVVMADWSTKPIKRIKVGEYVMGSDNYGQLSPTRVVRVFRNGQRPCKTWRFRVGSCRTRFVELTATADHKILAQIKAGRPGSTYAYRSQYRPTPLPLAMSRPQRNPAKNEFVAWPSRGELAGCSGVAEPRALLLGLLLGDGYTPRGRQHTLSCGDPLLVSDIATYLASLNLWLKPPAAGYSYTLHEIVKSKQMLTVRGGRNCFSTTGNPIKQWLEQLGCVGKLAHEKQLPTAVWTWNLSSVCHVIAGLIATDGTIELRADGCTIKFKLTSRQIVEQTQRLLELRLGVWGTGVRRVPKETIPLGNYDQWEITISHPEAVQRLARYVQIPGVKGHQLKAGLERLSLSPRSAEVGFKLHSVKPVGMRPTWDIEVDNEHHLFLLDTGLVVSNSATQDAGFFGKQLLQAAHRLIVTADDSDDPYDEQNPRGLPVPVDDPDNAGAFLAHPVNGLPRNTRLTPKHLKMLKAAGVDEILVRSPLVGGPADGGVYSKDVGYHERGRAPIGDYVGITAAQSVTNPITQAQISSKHSGGIAGAGAGAISGFKYINNLVQVPEEYAGWASIATRDGVIQAISEAPQGGTYVVIDGQRHYVPAKAQLRAKKGDTVEAGDALSSGTINPADVVKYKGLGEGQRYWVNTFKQALTNSDTYGNRRNIELVARGLINHVRLTDEVGDWSPDDVIPYNMLERTWEPRPGHVAAPPATVHGYYLEKPVLHYTVGTRITPRIASHLNKHSVGRVFAHAEKPPFEPEMIRGMAIASYDPDPFAAMLGGYQQKSLLNAVRRGRVSDTAGTSFVPSLAEGKDFGVAGPTKGWDSTGQEP